MMKPMIKPTGRRNAYDRCDFADDSGDPDDESLPKDMSEILLLD